jgi:hypothetical protein
MNTAPSPEQPKRSATSKVKIAVLIMGYAILVVGMAFLSIEKAINTTQEMGRYQIEETRIFQGEQKAKELEEFMQERTGQLEEPIPAGDSSTTE